MKRQAADTCEECDSWLFPQNGTLRAFAPTYPMYVIPVAALLRMDELTVHHKLLDDGHLTPWTEEMHGKVICVSHQWLSYAEPDPKGDHFGCLKRVLTRLMNGEIKRVENYWIHAWKFRTLALGSKHWRAALPDMYVWIDYSSMPQVTPGGDVASVQHAANAIVSLPAYVERCALLLVVAPVVTHVDTNLTCNYATWRQRGWCRLELLAAVLAPRDVRVMVCTGAEAIPFLVHPFDGPRLLPSTGRFSCCDLGHMHCGAPMECDKAKIRPVLETMIDSKVFQLTMQGRHYEQTFWASLRDYFVSGLPKVRSKSGTAPKVHRRLKELLQAKKKELRLAELTGDCLLIFKAQIGWSEEHERSAARSGLTLLHCACLAGNAAAARALAAQPGTKIDAGLRFDMPQLAYMWKGATPLMAAMTYAGYDCVEALLDAKAAPHAATACGVTGLIAASCRGNVQCVAAFLRRHPDADLEHRARFFPMTAGAIAAVSSPNKLLALRALIAARANLNDSQAWGGSGSLLNFAAMGEDCDQSSIRLLLDSGLDVNSRYDPMSRDWSCRLRAVRLLEPCSGSRVLATLAMIDGATALHGAAMRGDTTLVRLLVEAKAASLRNRQGRTPLDVARAFFGDVPDALEACLREAELGPAARGEADRQPTLLGLSMRSAVLAAVQGGAELKKEREVDEAEASEAWDDVGEEGGAGVVG